MALQYLVLTDVDAIQRYVFDSIRLATIVGASKIVANFDRTLECDEGEDAKHDAEVAVLSGGNGLFVFSDKPTAKAFVARVPDQFRSAAGGGTITASNIEPFEGDEGYREALQRALASLKDRKQSGQQSDEPIGLGLVHTCEYCGAEPAGLREITVGGKARRIGSTCAKKWDARNQAKDVAEDFNQLAGDDYLAIIAIDGDGLGTRLQEQPSVDRYADFSAGVKHCISRAIAAATSIGQSTESNSASPFQNLYQGGDDIVVACPSQWALPFAAAFSKSIESENWDWAGESGQIGFSIGISVTHSGFPVRSTHQIANRLLRHAKQVAKDRKWNEGAIDFAIVTESMGDAELILREREIVSHDGRLRLSGRPYRLKSGEPHSLSSLKKACDELRDFPRNRIYTLRNELTASRIMEARDVSPTTLRWTTKRIEGRIAAWQRRVDRDPALKNAWEAASANLPVKEDRTYPHGDVADALYLWEKCLGSRD